MSYCRPKRRRLDAFARDFGVVLVDTELLFREHFQHSRLSLDVGPMMATSTRLVSS